MILLFLGAGEARSSSRSFALSILTSIIA